MPKKRKKSKKRSQKKIKKRTIKAIIAILVLILMVISLSLLIEFRVIKNPLKEIKLRAESKNFEIKDNCAVIVGRLIHSINDENTCELMCKTTCSTLEMKFQSSEFMKKEEDCNKCSCNCK